MADKIFDVEVSVSRMVRVRVPVDDKDVMADSTPMEVAEEFALGGKRSWPDYVISEDSDSDVVSISEVAPAISQPTS